MSDYILYAILGAAIGLGFYSLHEHKRAPRAPSAIELIAPILNDLQRQINEDWPDVMEVEKSQSA